MKRFIFCTLAFLTICTTVVAQPTPKIEHSIMAANYDFTKSKISNFAWTNDVEINISSTKLESITNTFSFKDVNTNEEKVKNAIILSNQKLKEAGWKYSKLEIVAISEKSITFNIVGTMILQTWGEYCGTTNWIPGQCNGCEQAYTSAQLLRLTYLAQGYTYVCIMPPHNSPDGCDIGWCGWKTCYQVVASNEFNCELQ